MNMITCSLKHAKKLIITLLLIITPLFSAIISIKPSTSEVLIGSQFYADIMVEELGINEMIGAFDLNVQYDPSILYFNEYSLTNELSGVTNSNVLDLSVGLTNPGEVNISGLLLLDNFDSSLNTLKLASVIFSAVNEGISTLGLSDVTLANYFGDAISTVIQNGSVQSVPEASSMALMCTGLVCFAGVFLIRKKSGNCKSKFE
jgi:hypothetical protein